MKKLLLSLICLCISIGSFAGCTKKEDKTDQQRTVTLEELGLTYTIPASWTEDKNVNIVPLTLRGENTFAEIAYLYIPQAGMEEINKGTKSASQVGQIVCELVIAKTETFNNGSQEELINYFETSEKVGEQGDYSYYLLTKYKTVMEALKGDDLEIYNKLVSSASELGASVKTKEFDPSVLEEQINNLNSYVTFDTESIGGASVDSTIFADYDITIMTFGSTKTYSQYNEVESLESLYSFAKNIRDKRVNLIYAVVDTPNEESEKIVKKVLEEEDAGFLTIKMDQYLSSWAEKNINKIPSTIFVDSNGQMIGDVIEGSKDQQVYLDELQKRIEEINSRNKK